MNIKDYENNVLFAKEPTAKLTTEVDLWGWYRPNSSAVKCFKYDEDTQDLVVIFRSNINQRYRYVDVPKKIFEELLQTDSAGTYLATHIATVYNYYSERIV